MWFEFLTVMDSKIAACWTVMLYRFLPNYCAARHHLSEVFCFPYLVSSSNLWLWSCTFTV